MAGDRAEAMRGTWKAAGSWGRDRTADLWVMNPPL